MKKPEYGYKKIASEKTGINLNSEMQYANKDMNSEDLKILMQAFSKRIIDGVYVPYNWDDLTLDDQKQWVINKALQNEEENNVLKFWKARLEAGKKIV